MTAEILAGPASVPSASSEPVPPPLVGPQTSAPAIPQAKVSPLVKSLLGHKWLVALAVFSAGAEILKSTYQRTLKRNVSPSRVISAASPFARGRAKAYFRQRCWVLICRYSHRPTMTVAQSHAFRFEDAYLVKFPKLFDEQQPPSEAVSPL